MLRPAASPRSSLTKYPFEVSPDTRVCWTDCEPAGVPLRACVAGVVRNSCGERGEVVARLQVLSRNIPTVKRQISLTTLRFRDEPRVLQLRRSAEVSAATLNSSVLLA